MLIFKINIIIKVFNKFFIFLIIYFRFFLNEELYELFYSTTDLKFNRYVKNWL